MLYVGRIVQRQKRFFDAIRVFNNLPVYQKTFDVVGMPKPGILTDIHIDDRVNFHGFLDNWHQLIRERTVLIIPSEYEGLPLVLLEFIKSGGEFLICKKAEWCCG